jgi:hypothetical protein
LLCCLTESEQICGGHIEGSQQFIDEGARPRPKIPSGEQCANVLCGQLSYQMACIPGHCDVNDKVSRLLNRGLVGGGWRETFVIQYDAGPA